MKVHYFSILVWCVISVNPSVIWPQWSHTPNVQCPRITWSPTNDKKGVCIGQGGVSSKRTNQIPHIWISRARETAKARNESYSF